MKENFTADGRFNFQCFTLNRGILGVGTGVPSYPGYHSRFKINFGLNTK